MSIRYSEADDSQYVCTTHPRLISGTYAESEIERQDDGSEVGSCERQTWSGNQMPHCLLDSAMVHLVV